MLAGRLLQRNNQRPRLRALLVPLFSIVLICLLYSLVPVHSRPSPIPPPRVQERPLIKEHIDHRTSHNASNGGRWYIPESWIQLAEHSVEPLFSNPRPTNVLDAAQLALELSLRDHRYLNNSGIPLIVHQTWKTPDTSGWPDIVKDSVEGWLEAATGRAGPLVPQMAYFFWADEGIDQFITRYEPQLWNAFNGLPYNVEKADAFRVAVLKWFGGIYSDVDTRLLQHPSNWIHPGDLRDWTDPESNHTFFAKDRSHARYAAPPLAPQPYKEMIAQHKAFGSNVGAIFGIEADTSPESDDYWRMGYTYPVQITNWALAMVPHHPTASDFLEQMVDDMTGMNSTLLSRIDPLDLTGPPALTKAIKSYSESSTAHFRWNGLSGIHDGPGGRGKIIAGDVLVLPITGFSPGRGRFHNMGSQPLSNHNARLFHAAAGSWRHASLQVQVGKMCRTLLGQCRNWSKIP